MLGDLVAGQIGRQQFDGHMPIQPGVVRLIDDAHAARAELAHDAIRAEACAGLERHGGAEYIAERRMAR